MKLRVLGPNQTEVEADVAVVLFSYNVPVAAKIADEYFTVDRKYSTTTTRHINAWINGSKTTPRNQRFFDNLLVVRKAVAS